MRIGRFGIIAVVGIGVIGSLVIVAADSRIIVGIPRRSSGGRWRPRRRYGVVGDEVAVVASGAAER